MRHPSFPYFSLFIPFLLFFASISIAADTLNNGTHDEWVKIEVERLPDLNTPRSGHFTFCINGEYVVMGGHTSGFVPTATAEYYLDGTWHQIPMVYKHDQGFAVQLSSGKVMIGGGHEQDLGIGQIYSVEMYDPVTRQFDGFGCMNTKRTIFCGTEIDSGRVVISGNWYHNDDIELWDGQQTFTHVKEVTQSRSYPFIFRTAHDNVVIFSVHDTRMDMYHDSIIVDRLIGKPYTPELFRQWKPLHIQMTFCSYQSFIGDETKNDYAYLFPVTDTTGQVAIAQLRGEVFSLLATDGTIPMRDEQWREHFGDTTDSTYNGEIQWLTPVIAHRQAQRAYLVGTSKDPYGRIAILYVLTIDYAHTPATLTLGFTDPQPDAGFSTPILTADGNLLMTGGLHGTNFQPFASVLLLRVGQHSTHPSSTDSYLSTFLYCLLFALFSFLIIYMYMRARKKQQHMEALSPKGEDKEEPDDTPTDLTEFMNQIRQFIEQEQLYLKPDLKVSNIATALNTSTRRVSDCINSCQNGSFSSFINSYRIEHAKRLLREQPYKKISIVWRESGFASETNFFRTFKAFTDMTPTEWIQQKDQ